MKALEAAGLSLAVVAGIAGAVWLWNHRDQCTLCVKLGLRKANTVPIPPGSYTPTSGQATEQQGPVLPTGGNIGAAAQEYTRRQVGGMLAYDAEVEARRNPIVSSRATA